MNLYRAKYSPAPGKGGKVRGITFAAEDLIEAAKKWCRLKLKNEELDVLTELRPCMVQLTLEG